MSVKLEGYLWYGLAIQAHYHTSNRLIAMLDVEIHLIYSSVFIIIYLAGIEIRIELRHTLLVIFGPLAADTDWPKKTNAKVQISSKETTILCREAMSDSVRCNDRRV